uniref:C-type lectin domain-containing protein n=1 Tax=Stegastes partitus TaxID=144197 RepID=A0A3B4ZLP3_9TELE
ISTGIIVILSVLASFKHIVFFFFNQTFQSLCFKILTEKGSGEFPLLVVSEPKTWKEAQEYCRKNSKDLASVRSQIKSVWIGLFKDKWTWSDQSGSSFRHWQSSQPNNDGDCAIYSPKSKSWYDRNCKYKWPFYCYNGKFQNM